MLREPCNNFAISPDSRRLVTVGDDYILWELDTSEKLATLTELSGVQNQRLPVSRSDFLCCSGLRVNQGSCLMRRFRNCTGSLWPAIPKWPELRSLPGCG